MGPGDEHLAVGRDGGAADLALVALQGDDLFKVVGIPLLDRAILT